MLSAEIFWSNVMTHHANAYADLAVPPPAVDTERRGYPKGRQEGNEALYELLNRQPNPLTVLETYSRWLGGKLRHDLISYWNPRRSRIHTVCWERGSGRSRLLERAREVAQPPLPRNRFWRQGDLWYYLWEGCPLERFDHLLLITAQPSLSIEEANPLLRQSLVAFSEAFHRAMDEADQSAKRRQDEG